MNDGRKTWMDERQKKSNLEFVRSGSVRACVVERWLFSEMADVFGENLAGARE